jgi:hypothetical protein
MKTILPGLFLLTFISCGSVNNGNKDKKYFAAFLKDVDQLQLVYFNKGDTLKQLITDQTQIETYKELINGKADPKDKLKCDSTGRIEFLSKGSTVLNAWFSTPATGSKLSKPCVTYSAAPQVFSTAFTYRCGRDVDDYYFKLRSSANRMAKDL